MGFPAKNDHFGVFGGYHYLRKHPKMCVWGFQSIQCQLFFLTSCWHNFILIIFWACYLVGGWTTHLKNMLVKLDHVPRVKINKLKPPPRKGVFAFNICIKQISYPYIVGFKTKSISDSNVYYHNVVLYLFNLPAKMSESQKGSRFDSVFGWLLFVPLKIGMFFKNHVGRLKGDTHPDKLT